MQELLAAIRLAVRIACECVNNFAKMICFPMQLQWRLACHIFKGQKLTA